jgi:hypothetical protein
MNDAAHHRVRINALSCANPLGPNYTSDQQREVKDALPAGISPKTVLDRFARALLFFKTRNNLHLNHICLLFARRLRHLICEGIITRVSTV